MHGDNLSLPKLLNSEILTSTNYFFVKNILNFFFVGLKKRLQMGFINKTFTVMEMKVLQNKTFKPN